MAKLFPYIANQVLHGELIFLRNINVQKRRRILVSCVCLSHTIAKYLANSGPFQKPSCGHCLLNNINTKTLNDGDKNLEVLLNLLSPVDRQLLLLHLQQVRFMHDDQLYPIQVSGTGAIAEFLGIAKPNPRLDFKYLQVSFPKCTPEMLDSFSELSTIASFRWQAVNNRKTKIISIEALEEITMKKEVPESIVSAFKLSDQWFNLKLTNPEIKAFLAEPEKLDESIELGFMLKYLPEYCKTQIRRYALAASQPVPSLRVPQEKYHEFLL